MTTWTPLLQNETDATAALAALEAITTGLLRLADAPAGPPGLYSGTSGLAVFFAHRAQATGRGDYADAASAFLNHAAGALARNRVGPGLGAGIAGVAWALVHCQRTLEGDFDPTLTEGLDTALLDHLDRAPRADALVDVVSGLAGIGLYALELLPHPRGAELFQRAVAKLEAWAEPAPAGRCWFTPPHVLPDHQRAVAPRGYYNTGLAHGAAGIIAMMAAGRRAGLSLPPGLLEDAVSWLEGWRRTDARGSYFPTWVIVGAEERALSARNAWCYGDPAIAIAMAMAGSRHARDIAARAVARPAAGCGVVDAGLCHGSAGLALCHARLAALLPGARAHEDAARHWTLGALALPVAPPDGEAAGSRVDGGQPNTAPQPWLLNGFAGVGLVLQAALGTQPPDWDRALACSMR